MPQRDTGLTASPRADDTASPAANTLRAAFTSRSWIEPHSGSRIVGQKPFQIFRAVEDDATGLAIQYARHAVQPLRFHGVSQSVPAWRVFGYPFVPEPVVWPDELSIHPKVIKNAGNLCGEQEFDDLGDNLFERIRVFTGFPEVDLLAAERVIGDAVLPSLAFGSDVVDVHLIKRDITARVEALPAEGHKHGPTQQPVCYWDWFKNTNHLSSPKKRYECFLVDFKSCKKGAAIPLPPKVGSLLAGNL